MSVDGGLVLHVINSLGLSGGAEQQLVTNLSRFTDSKIRHHVAYLYVGTDPSWTAGMKVATTDLNGSKESASLVASGRHLYRLVKSLRPDLIHCSLVDSSLISRIVGRLTRTPVLESLVNISHESIRTVDSATVKRWKLAIYRLLDRLTMRWVTAFHALTEEVARSWVDTVGIDRNRITVIPRGVAVEALEAQVLTPEERADVRREVMGQPDGLMIVAVGREEPQKGHRYLIDAMPAISADRPDARLVMAGRRGASSAAMTSQIAEAGLEDRIVRLGVRSDVHRLLRAADVMVFPSLYEGLGVSLIEGMAAGVPVVVFDRPPMNQIIEHDVTGLVVAERDPVAISNAVLSLAANHELANRLGSAAGGEVRDHYDIEDTAGRIEELYRKLIVGKSSRSDSEGTTS